MKITVWKCDHTGKLFEDHSKYKAHLRKLARERQQRRKLEVVVSEADAWWAAAYEREMSIEDFKNFIIENQDRFWQDAARSEGFSWNQVGKIHRGVVCPVPKLLEFTKFDLHWSDSVGNTHSCPHNGVTNWAAKDASLPTGYPGWRGAVEWIVEFPEQWRSVYLGSDLFRGRRGRCHTGTGGGRGGGYSVKHGCYTQRYGYDFSVYAADWTGMARGESKRQFAEVLEGSRNSTSIFVP